jgi:hypothetical protein
LCTYPAEDPDIGVADLTDVTVDRASRALNVAFTLALIRRRSARRSS